MKKAIKAIAGLSLAGLISAMDGSPVRHTFERTPVVNELTDANRRLREFPDELPGMSTVKKYENPGAKYVLVHVRQIHKVTFDPRMIETVQLPHEIDAVNRCQREIESALVYLIENRGLKEVYCEGLTDVHSPSYQTAEDWMQHIKSTRDVNHIIQRMIWARRSGRPNSIVYPSELKEGQTPEQYRHAQRKLFEELGRKKTELEKRAIETASAVYKLGAFGRIRVLPADTTLGILGASAAVRSRDQRPVLDDRENLLLERIAKSSDPIHVVVYGSAHDFGTPGRHEYGGREASRSELGLKVKCLPILSYS